MSLPDGNERRFGRMETPCGIKTGVLAKGSSSLPGQSRQAVNDLADKNSTTETRQYQREDRQQDGKKRLKSIPPRTHRLIRDNNENFGDEKLRNCFLSKTLDAARESRSVSRDYFSAVSRSIYWKTNQKKLFPYERLDL